MDEKLRYFGVELLFFCQSDPEYGRIWSKTNCFTDHEVANTIQLSQ